MEGGGGEARSYPPKSPHSYSAFARLEMKNRNTDSRIEEKTFSESTTQWMKFGMQEVISAHYEETQHLSEEKSIKVKIGWEKTLRLKAQVTVNLDDLSPPNTERCSGGERPLWLRRRCANQPGNGLTPPIFYNLLEPIIAIVKIIKDLR